MKEASIEELKDILPEDVALKLKLIIDDIV